MKKGLWSKRIPTILALSLLFISIWVTSFLIQSGIIVVGQATPNKTPNNVAISNITDTSFTVSFTTNEETLAGLAIDPKDGTSDVVYDDRNKTNNNLTAFYSHFITVSKLQPATTYNFSILSDGQTYLDQNKKYSATTAPKIPNTLPSQNTISGKILLPDGSAGEDSIVGATIGGVQKLTAVTRSDGTYIISTSPIRNDLLDNFVRIAPNQEVVLTVLRQNMRSSVKTLFSDAQVIPVITLQEQYDFSEVEQDQVSTFSSQLKIPAPQVGIGAPAIKILSPKEGDSLIDARPLFRGTAIPNQTVKITIKSNPIVAEAKADSSGAWSFRPTTELGTGPHTITIESVDRFGILRSVSLKFAVFASGSQIAQSATPSATPILTSTPTPNVSLIPTPTVAIIPSATPTSPATPTLTPLPTVAPQITPVPPGNTTSLVLTTISVLLIFAGSALLFLL